MTKSRRTLQTTSEEASLDASDSLSSSFTPVLNSSDGHHDPDQDLLDEDDHAELRRIHTKDIHLAFSIAQTREAARF